MSLPSIAVLLPTKNDEMFIATTIYALADEIARYRAAGGAVRWCVVNDGSTDGTGAIVSALRERGAYTLIDRADNRGVTRSLSEAFDAVAAGSELVLRCDADARFAVSGWMAAMAQFLTSDPRIGVVAPLMLFPDGTIDCHGVDYFPGGRRFRDHGVAYWERRELAIEEVDTVLGAYSLMRTAHWSIDTGYFLWLEDEEQGLSLRARGLKCYSMAQPAVVHYNRIRAARVSDKPQRGKGREEVRRALRFASRHPPLSTLRGLANVARGRAWSHRAPDARERIWIDNFARFTAKWGFDPRAPDLTAIRARYPDSELLWNESAERRAIGREIAARYAAAAR